MVDGLCNRNWNPDRIPYFKSPGRQFCINTYHDNCNFRHDLNKLTWKTFTHAIYNLAAHPEYTQPLREEIEGIVATDGWTKASVMKMRKLDSFLKESMRMHPLGYSNPPPFPSVQRTLTNIYVVGNGRVAVKDYTFSNGMNVPRGTAVYTPAHPIQYDERIYVDPLVFDGFRFSRMREREGESAKHHASNTSTEFLNFGHGQHAW